MPHSPGPIDSFETPLNPPATPDVPATSAPPPPPAAPRFTVRQTFFGRDGLRAGWSLLLYAALLYALLSAGGALLHKLRHHSAPQPTAAANSTPQATKPPAPATPSTSPASTSPSSNLMPAKDVLPSEAMLFFCVALATWIMATIERRPTSVFGLGGQRRLPRFLAGFAWGLALLSLLVFTLRAIGLLAFDARLLFGRGALRYGLIWLACFLLVGLFEEYFFRGYLQYTLARGLGGIYGWFHAPNRGALGFWTATLLISFGFGFSHQSNPGESPIGLLSASLIAVVFCLSLARTGSLWWAIGFHAAWDWAQSFLYGVADSGTMVRGHLLGTHPIGRPIFSGGLTGPEGSLFILPTLALVAAVILLTLPRTHFSYPPHGASPPPLH